MIRAYSLFFLISSLMILDYVEARGKRKKKGSSSSNAGGPTCATLGLDCSSTCCQVDVCAEMKLDCAKKFKRPFEELYTGFGSILLITIGISLMICFINFCLMHKFCRRYDENLDFYVGGFSICDLMMCLFTCGAVGIKWRD